MDVMDGWDVSRLGWFPFSPSSQRQHILCNDCMHSFVGGLFGFNDINCPIALKIFTVYGSDTGIKKKKYRTNEMYFMDRRNSTRIGWFHPFSFQAMTVEFVQRLWAFHQLVGFSDLMIFNHPVVLKFCTMHGSDTVVLCVKFQNDWAKEMAVMVFRKIEAEWRIYVSVN